MRPAPQNLPLPHLADVLWLRLRQQDDIPPLPSQLGVAEHGRGNLAAIGRPQADALQRGEIIRPVATDKD
jgi:hypothetical protein